MSEIEKKYQKKNILVKKEMSDSKKKLKTDDAVKSKATKRISSVTQKVVK